MSTARTIMIVNPNTTASMTSTIVSGARAAAAQGTTVLGSSAKYGVDSIEGNVDEVWGALAVLAQVRAGELADVDGYVIACFGDTGLPAARETARGPVVGMTEAALFTAALLAPRFTIVTLPPRTREQSHRVLRETGLAHRCTVRAIDVPVIELAGGSAHLFAAVAAQARVAIETEGAEALILGCAGLSELVRPLARELNVPVIDGVAAAVTMVEGLLAQCLTTSRLSTYARPERLGPPDFDLSPGR